ncbi:MAG: hypothetical protein ACREMU_10040 [Gemmatimonadaceae bacterium]
MPLGCWRLEPGHFAVIGNSGVDPGQTTLPDLIQFDTVPGKSWAGDPWGRRVRALHDTIATRYREGYYLPAGADSVRVDWTNGFVGMTLMLRRDSVTMRGHASAWTDYLGEEDATIVLRRVTCAGGS